MAKKEICIYRADASSCNGCDIEILAALAPRYRLNELGIKVVENPGEASVLLVTGGGNIKVDRELKGVYDKIQPPKIVVAVGSCAISWEVFEGGYSIVGPVDETLPVNAYVCGCPPRPQAIVDALAKTLGIEIEEKEGFWRAPEGFRGKQNLDPEKCTACSACEHMCPARSIEITEENGWRTVKYLLGKCSYCRTCEIVCPEEAVRLTKDYRLLFRSKRDAIVTANIKLTECAQCGNFFVSPRQLESAVNRIEEKVKEYAEFREDIKQAMELCLNCRTKITNIKMAKRLLVQLTAKALENS